MSELPKLGYYKHITFQSSEYYIFTGKKLTKEQAEEIAHRCNCHHDLVAACKKARKHIMNMGFDPATGGIITAIDTALAKVKKE